MRSDLRSSGHGSGHVFGAGSPTARGLGRRTCFRAPTGQAPAPRSRSTSSRPAARTRLRFVPSDSAEDAYECFPLVLARGDSRSVFAGCRRCSRAARDSAPWSSGSASACWSMLVLAGCVRRARGRHGFAAKTLPSISARVSHVVPCERHARYPRRLHLTGWHSGVRHLYSPSAVDVLAIRMSPLDDAPSTRSAIGQTPPRSQGRR
jgi:hypothetical protein